VATLFDALGFFGPSGFPRWGAFFPLFFFFPNPVGKKTQKSLHWVGPRGFFLSPPGAFLGVVGKKTNKLLCLETTRGGVPQTKNKHFNGFIFPWNSLCKIQPFFGTLDFQCWGVALAFFGFLGF